MMDRLTVVSADGCIDGVDDVVVEVDVEVNAGDVADEVEVDC